MLQKCFQFFFRVFVVFFSNQVSVGLYIFVMTIVKNFVMISPKDEIESWTWIVCIPWNFVLDYYATSAPRSRIIYPMLKSLVILPVIIQLSLRSCRALSYWIVKFLGIKFFNLLDAGIGKCTASALSFRTFACPVHVSLSVLLTPGLVIGSIGRFPGWLDKK